MSGNAVGAVVLLLLVVAVDAWVFLDARGQQAAGHEVVASVGPVTLSKPEQWLIGCIIFWIFVVPLYLVARRA